MKKFLQKAMVLTFLKTTQISNFSFLLFYRYFGYICRSMQRNASISTLVELVQWVLRYIPIFLSLWCKPEWLYQTWIYANPWIHTWHTGVGMSCPLSKDFAFSPKIKTPEKVFHACMQLGFKLCPQVAHKLSKSKSNKILYI